MLTTAMMLLTQESYCQSIEHGSNVSHKPQHESTLTDTHAKLSINSQYSRIQTFHLVGLFKWHVSIWNNHLLRPPFLLGH